jgi:hypothetical protein
MARLGQLVFLEIFAATCSQRIPNQKPAGIKMAAVKARASTVVPGNAAIGISA